MCIRDRSIWFNQHTEEGEMIAELAIESAQKRTKEVKVVERKKSFQGPALPGKLSDCNSDNLDETELFLVEGDSAEVQRNRPEKGGFKQSCHCAGKYLILGT